MTPGKRGWIVLALLALAASAALAAPGHPHHGPEHFYATWMMPDAPKVSCCSNEDCAPAQARIVDGKWQARFVGESEWIDIPDHKVERERDMPDGQAHLCGFRDAWGRFVVYCFGSGAGG